MEALSLQSLENQWIITIDKKQFPPELIVKLLKRLRLEWLAQNAEFDEDLASELAEKIETNWWNDHGEEFLKNVEK